MEFADKPNFDAQNKQRELLISGHFNTLFNDLTFNLPVRFFKYARPENLNRPLKEIFNYLESVKKSFNKNDAWDFNDLKKIITPLQKFTNTADILKFLTLTCKIPEKQIILKNDITENSAFPAVKIYVSRYVAYVITNKYSDAAKSLDNDLNTTLFTSNKTDSAEDFELQNRFAFTGFYFACRGMKLSEITNVMWTWIRGEQLKKSYDSAMTDFECIVKGIMGKKFNYHELEEFKQKFIFDILFKTPGFNTFRDQYNATLQSLGYKLKSEDDGDIKWHNGVDTAPKYPHSFLSPHITFLITWLVKKFCEFEKNEFNYNIKNRKDWFEKLAKNFFSSVKDALNLEKFSRMNSEYDFSKSDFFTYLHHSKNLSMGIVKNIKNGSGKTTINSQTGQKTHKNPSALEFWHEQSLFCDDENLCVNIRKSAEQKLSGLHLRYINNPSFEIAQQIIEQEKIIYNECLTLYGFNFQAWVELPNTIGRDGKITSRPIFGHEKPITEFYIPKDVLNTDNKDWKLTQTVQYKITPPDLPQIKTEKIYLNNVPLANFQILSETPEIKFGHGVSIFSYKDEKSELKNYWKLDKDGIFQTINPLIEKPVAFKKDNIPSLVRENFQMRNFVIESDTMSLKQQVNLAKKLISLGVINRALFSGNKSIHMNITIKDSPKTNEEYKWLFFYLGMKFGLVNRTFNPERIQYNYTGIIDLSLCHNAAKTRRPGAFRILETNDKNGNTVQKKVEQKLLHQTNVIYDINWRPIYESEQEKLFKLSASKINLINYKTNDVSDTVLNKRREKVKSLLDSGWCDGNRNNMLFNYDGNGGIVNLMFNAGYTESEIFQILSQDANNNLIHQIKTCIKRSVAR